MNFFGSDCSSASTPASNGSASNGLSSEVDCASGSAAGSSPKPSGSAAAAGSAWSCGWCLTSELQLISFFFVYFIL